MLCAWRNVGWHYAGDAIHFALRASSLAVNLPLGTYLKIGLEKQDALLWRLSGNLSNSCSAMNNKSTTKPGPSKAPGEVADTSASAQSGSLAKSSLTVSLMTLVSRCFGLARDMVIAYFFGAAAGADAFFLAFRIPNFFRRIFAEGAFSQAFVPILADYKANRSEVELHDLVNRVAGTLGMSLLVLTILGVLGAEWVIKAFAAGYIYNNELEKLRLATDMLRLTFPYLLLISMTAFSGAVLNTFGRFAVPAFTPVLLNLSLILSAICLRPWLAEPVMALAWGVLIAGVAQLSFQLPFLASLKLLPRPKTAFRDPGVRRILVLMLPAVIGASASQINLLVDTLLASFLETGSLSWLYYSDRLLELPLALFGIAIATVILPGLSREHARQAPAEFSDTLHWSIRLVLIFGIPASVALVFLSDELIATLFYQGAMTRRDLSMSGLALAAYGAGLLGHMLIKVLVTGYFARQDMASPVRFGLISLGTNLLLNVTLIWFLQHVGLALATSLSAFINASLLFRGLVRQKVLLASSAEPVLIKVLISVLCMGICLYLITPDLEWWLGRTFLPRLATMLLICTAGAITYALALFVLGINMRRLVR